MPKVTGYSLIAIGVIHTIYGVLFGYSALVDIANRGVFNAVGNDPTRQLVVWFLITGILMVALGYLCLKLTAVPTVFGIFLVALAVIGLVLMPDSGFWLILILGIFVLVTNRRHEAV